MVRAKIFFAAAFAVTGIMFMSTQAFAYTGSGTEADHFIVKTEDDLNSCVQKGEYIDLGADIVLNGGVDISTKRIRLDLCGHSCTLAQTSDTGSVSMFTVSNNKQFFIDDSSGQNGTLSTTGAGYTVLKCNNGYLYIDGGNFLSESGVTLNVGAYASVNINDGFFKTEKNYPTAYVTSNARGTLNINGGTFENGEKYGGLYFDNPMVDFYSRINGGIFNRMYIRDNNYMDLIINKCTVYNQLYCTKKRWGYIADDSSVYVDKTKQDRNVNSNVFEGDKIEVFSGPADIKAVFDGGEYLSPPTQYFSDYYPTVTEPEMPYGFNGKYVSGWYTDSKFKNKFDFDTPLENDITLYAKWVSIDNEFDMTADGNTVTRKVFYGDWVTLWADEVLDYKKGISWTVRYPLSNGSIRSYKTTSNAYAFLEMDPFEEPFDIILKEGNKVEIYAQGYSADDPDTAVTTDTVILDVIYKRGDIDGNGKIEQNDAALYLKHLSDIPEYVFSEKQNERADANFNGDNDMLDVITILKTAKK